MTKLIKFEVKNFTKARVIGKEVIHILSPDEQNPIPTLWDKMFKDGSFEFLKNLSDSENNQDLVGWMGDYNPATKEFIYIAGVLAKPSTSVPEGYAYRDIPDCQMGIAWIQGEEKNGDIYNNASELTAKAKNENGYEYDSSAGNFVMEYYSYERYGLPLKKGENEVILDYYSPCKKKAENISVQ